MDEGFLRLSRRFFSNEMWKEARVFSECEAWLDLIRSARFDATDEAYSEYIGGREISYSRGQYPASISFLMKRWKWSEKKVRYFLAKLKKKGMITTCNQQGVTVITLCNYNEYNPVKVEPKDRDKDVDWGIDNTNKINELSNELGRLRAELRARAEEISKKMENLGQAKGRKKKNINNNQPDDNIPPTPPKGEGINLKARSLFESHYRDTFGSDYYWTAKDAGAMFQLLQKLRFQREQKQMDVADESILYALRYLLSSITEGWIFENFSVTNINSKFNEIISQAKSRKNGKPSHSVHSGGAYIPGKTAQDKAASRQSLEDLADAILGQHQAENCP